MTPDPNREAEYLVSQLDGQWIEHAPYFEAVALSTLGRRMFYDVNGDVLTLPVVEDKVYVLGEVKAPGAQDFRPDLTPRRGFRRCAGGPGRCR